MNLPKVLMVDDDLGSIKLMIRMLAGVAEVQFATEGTDALRLATESKPALVLLDAQMPGMCGFQVCEAFKADAALADIPVIFVTNQSEVSFEVAGLEAGAVDFIAKPVSGPLLVARVRTHLRLSQMSAELRRVATIDGLTQVANRRFFDQALHKEWQRVPRSGDALTLLMVDVDHFKAFNDHYGHPAGDACLQRVAQALIQACLRPTDLVARYGGEEFVLLLPQTPRAGAEHVAARVLMAVESLAIPHAASQTATHLTVSVGVSSFDEQSAGWVGTPVDSRLAHDSGVRFPAAAFLRAADVALYAAKAAGRAQAWMLDVADADTPMLAREVLAREVLRPGRLSPLTPAASALRPTLVAVNR